jgi:hypothetical protein
MKIPTHYATLGLAPNATPEVMRAAYKALALTYGPDESAGLATAELAARAAAFDEIQGAFEVLDDQSQKAVYDAELARNDSEVIDEALAFHHRSHSTLGDCTTAPITHEQETLMRTRVHRQVRYWRVLREKRREADAGLSIPELKSLVEIWEDLQLENAADPAIKARCAIVAHEYTEEVNTRECEIEERLRESSTLKRTSMMPATPIAEQPRPKTPSAPTSLSSPPNISDAAARFTRLDISLAPMPPPFSRVSARAAERARAEEKRVEEAKARTEARKEREAQIEAAKQAALEKKAALVRAQKAKLKAIIDEKARAKAAHIARVRAKVRGGPVGINDVGNDFVASGEPAEQEGMLSHGVDVSNEGKEECKLQADNDSDAGTEQLNRYE